MGDQLVASTVTVLLAIVSLAVIATLVSKNANTSGVISAGGSAFSGALAAAEAPVTGGGGLGLNSVGTYPGSGFQN